MNRFAEYLVEGSALSGNHGHTGRLGQVGGSSSSSTAHYLVSGRVQGVQYRANALDVAHALCVEAHARNLPSSQVEIQATGDKDALSIFKSYLHYGNPGSVVSNVKTIDGSMKTLSEYDPGAKGSGLKNFSNKTEFDNHYGLVKTAGREGEGTQVTAYYERPIMLSTKYLSSLPGRYTKSTYEAWDKHYPEADLQHNDRIHAIADKLRMAHDGDVVTIQVTPGGKPTISEGGHILKDAQARGLDNVRAVVQFFGGGEKHYSPYTHLKESMSEGGAGSGNRNHVGRKGLVGGSGANGSPVAVAEKPIPGAEGFSGATAPWDMKATALPRYPGDTSVYSPALKDAEGNYPLGRRLQGELIGKPPGDEVNMYSFIPGSASQDQMSKLEGMIKAGCDHAQLHPGEICYNDANGRLVKVIGNNYWIRGNVTDIQALESKLTPAVAKEFGKQNAWSVMMTPVTPSGIVTTGKEITHMRVVVPFGKDTPPNTVGTPIVSLADQDKIMSIMSGPTGRRVWQHVDFNGMHIATDIKPEEADGLNSKVKALGGQQDAAHHGPDAKSIGATRFVPKDINIEDYTVKRMGESSVRMIRVMREVGTASSGNHGHVGNPGHVGGSGPSIPGGKWKQSAYIDVGQVSFVPIQTLLKMRGNALGKTNIEELKSALQSNGMHDVPVIEFNPKTGYAFLGEGNHRVEALSQLGYTHIPVRAYKNGNVDADTTGAIKMPTTPQGNKHGYIASDMAPDELGFGTRYTRPIKIREGGAGSGNHGHVGRKGRVGGAGPSLARMIAVRTLDGSGASFSTHGEPTPTQGYMVGEDGYERTVNVDLTDEDAVTAVISKYIKDKAGPLSRPSVYVGTWVEKGQIFLDNSHNIIDRSTALAYSKDNKQIAVWNIGAGMPEYTRKDGERPTGNDAKDQLTESQAHINIPKHKMFFSPTMSPRDIAKIIVAQAKKQLVK